MLLVLVHEAGHMVVAKWCGMRVERFSIFFGRPVASFTRGETQYAIGWLPLGGYVKISGMSHEEDVPPGTGDRTYARAATWRKVATIAAGPGVNILVAILAFTAIAWVGIPELRVLPRIDSVEAGGPADRAGILPGDRLVSVNGVRVTADTARDTLVRFAGTTIPVTVSRGQRAFTQRVTPRQPREGCDPVGPLGLSFATEPTGRLIGAGPVEGVRRGLDTTWFIVSESTSRMACVLSSSKARREIQSVVGVGAVYNEIAHEGLRTVLNFAAVLSLALAIFNLLPLPPLDGGHIVFALIERVRGKPLPRAVFERASLVGLALLLVLMVFTLQNDIINIQNGTVLGPR